MLKFTIPTGRALELTGTDHLYTICQQLWPHLYDTIDPDDAWADKTGCLDRTWHHVLLEVRQHVDIWTAFTPEGELVLLANMPPDATLVEGT